MASEREGRLHGKRALITGGANGVGAASVRLFAAEGVEVAIVDRDAAAGVALAAALRDEGKAVYFVEGDVSRTEDARHGVEEALVRLGHIDILFNHAGIIIVKPFLDFSLEEWDELMDNNAKSAFLMTRLVLPGMFARGTGTMVFTSTTGVKAATHLESLYCASKAVMPSSRAPSPWSTGTRASARTSFVRASSAPRTASTRCGSCANTACSPRRTTSTSCRGGSTSPRMWLPWRCSWRATGRASRTALELPVLHARMKA